MEVENELSESNSGAASPADRLLTVREAAALLGVQPATLYTWKWQGRIPAVKLTGKNGPLRFRLSALQKLIAEGEQHAAAREAPDAF